MQPPRLNAQASASTPLRLLQAPADQIESVTMTHSADEGNLHDLDHLLQASDSAPDSTCMHSPPGPAAQRLTRSLSAAACLPVPAGEPGPSPKKGRARTKAVSTGINASQSATSDSLTLVDYGSESTAKAQLPLVRENIARTFNAITSLRTDFEQHQRATTETLARSASTLENLSDSLADRVLNCLSDNLDHIVRESIQKEDGHMAARMARLEQAHNALTDRSQAQMHALTEAINSTTSGTTQTFKSLENITSQYGALSKLVDEVQDTVAGLRDMYREEATLAVPPLAAPPLVAGRALPPPPLVPLPPALPLPPVMAPVQPSMPIHYQPPMPLSLPGQAQSMPGHHEPHNPVPTAPSLQPGPYTLGRGNTGGPPPKRQRTAGRPPYNNTRTANVNHQPQNPAHLMYVSFGPMQWSTTPSVARDQFFVVTEEARRKARTADEWVYDVSLDADPLYVRVVFRSWLQANGFVGAWTAVRTPPYASMTARLM